MTAGDETIRLVSPPRKAVIGLLVSLLGLAFGVSLLLRPDPSANFAGVFLIAVFGWTAWINARAYRRPPVLELDPMEFRVLQASGSTWGALWRDIERFYLWRSSSGVEYVAIEYKPGRRPDDAAHRLSRTMGVDAVMPRCWALTNAELLELLSFWKDKRTPRSTAVPATPRAPAAWSA